MGLGRPPRTENRTQDEKLTTIEHHFSLNKNLYTVKVVNVMKRGVARPKMLPSKNDQLTLQFLKHKNLYFCGENLAYICMQLCKYAYVCAYAHARVPLHYQLKKLKTAGTTKFF